MQVFYQNKSALFSNKKVEDSKSTYLNLHFQNHQQHLLIPSITLNKTVQPHPFNNCSRSPHSGLLMNLIQHSSNLNQIQQITKSLSYVPPKQIQSTQQNSLNSRYQHINSRFQQTEFDVQEDILKDYIKENKINIKIKIKYQEQNIKRGGKNQGKRSESKKHIKRKINFDNEDGNENNKENWQDYINKMGQQRGQNCWKRSGKNYKNGINSGSHAYHYNSNEINNNNNKNQKITQFKISRYQQPMSHTYFISLSSHDLTQKQLKKLIKSQGLNDFYYTGEVKFQKCVGYLTAKKAVLDNLLSSNKKLLQTIKNNSKQRYFVCKEDLKLTNFKRGSEYLCSDCHGKLMLPLILKLSKGLNYHYDSYNGDTVQKLTIYNQFAQIVWEQNISLGPEFENRNLQGKVIITQFGVTVTARQLDNKLCRVSFFRSKILFNNDKQYKIEQLIPFQIDQRFFKAKCDNITPYRLYGYINNWQIDNYEQQKKKQKILFKLNSMLQLIVDKSVKIGQLTFSTAKNLFDVSDIKQKDAQEQLKQSSSRQQQSLILLSLKK